MRMTLIREDNLVIIDGRAQFVDLSYLPTGLHAMQWYGDHGEIERQGLMNQTIDSLEVFQAAIDRWQAAVDAEDNPPAPDLAALKVAKNLEINAARAAANNKSFFHGSKEFACDALSRSDIDGINGYVALFSTFPDAFPGGWKAVDNSYLPLPDIAAWKAFYASMVAAGSANFAHAQVLKQALVAATSAESVAQITW